MVGLITFLLPVPAGVHQVRPGQAGIGVQPRQDQGRRPAVPLQGDAFNHNQNAARVPLLAPGAV